MSDIDSYARPGNPVVDITGTDLVVLINYEATGTSSPTDHPLSQIAGVLNLPANVQTLLQTPLSTMGDQIWSQNTDSNGQTMRDRAAALITQGLITQSPSDHGAYNISVNLPTTGILRAIVIPGTTIVLSYELNGNSASFSAHNTQIWPAPDASFNLTFDLELLIVIGIPAQAGPLSTAASANVENAKISGSNITADVEDFGASLAAFFEGQPTNIFQVAEGNINAAGSGVSVNLGGLSTLLASVSTAWVQALPIGFTLLTASIDSGARTLDLRFTHPVDPAPVLFDAAVPSFPSLTNPILGTSSPVVQAGSSVGVTGTDFPLDQADNVFVGWQDTTSGNVIQSNLTWGPVGLPPQSVVIPRNGNDGKNLFTSSNVVSSTTYVFTVSDQDLLTQTPPSQPLEITTSLTNVVELIVELSGQQWAVGTASLTTTGSFATSINLPAGLQPGSYTLAAVVAGATLATTTLLVVGAGQTIPPTIEVIDPATNQAQSEVEESFPFTLLFQGFQPGVVTVTLGTAGGQLIGTATSAGPASFTAPPFVWPGTVSGPNTIVATQTVGGQTLTATYNIYAQALPQ